jgi:hypothetical protein
VPICQQANEQPFNHVFLTHNHFVHLQSDEIYERTFTLNAFVSFSNINLRIHKTIFL